MNKLIPSVRSFKLVAMTALLGIVVFSACNKNHNDDVDTPVAGLMAFNLSTDQSAVGFALSGSNLTNAPLSYTSYTGSYLGIYPGERIVESYDFNSSGGTIASTTGSFEPGKFYSVFLMGADSSYKNIIVDDNVDTLSDSTGQAYVRYVNAIPDSVSPPTVTITANGANVVDSPAPFSTVSNFVAVNPGDINIAVKNSSGIDATRTISVEEKKVYTVLLVGQVGSSTTPVEIKFIGNGTLSEAASRSRTSATGRVSGLN